MDKPDISVVIPAYNEEDNIRPLVKGVMPVMEGLGRPFEVIVLDDGSTDKTKEALRELTGSYPRLRAIRLKRNSGQSAALDAGFKAAEGGIIVTLDADLQYDPRDIVRLLERLGSCDMVCGWRRRRNDPWLKLVSTKIANAVRNKISGENIRDTGCSLKAFKREFLEGLKLYKGMHRFLPTLLKMQGARVVESEVRHLPRKAGRSKYNIRNRIVRSFFDLLFVTWMKRRNLDYETEVIK